MNRLAIEKSFTNIGAFTDSSGGRVSPDLSDCKVSYLVVHDYVRITLHTALDWADLCFEWLTAEDSNYPRHQLAHFVMLALYDQGRLDAAEIRTFINRLKATIPSDVRGEVYDKHVWYYESIYSEIVTTKR